MPRPRMDNIVKLVQVIRQRFHVGEAFYFGCKHKEYYIEQIKKSFPDAVFEDWDDGIVVRKQ